MAIVLDSGEVVGGGVVITPQPSLHLRVRKELNFSEASSLFTDLLGASADVESREAEAARLARLAVLLTLAVELKIGQKELFSLNKSLAM